MIDEWCTSILMYTCSKSPSVQTPGEGSLPETLPQQSDAAMTSG